MPESSLAYEDKFLFPNARTAYLLTEVPDDLDIPDYLRSISRQQWVAGAELGMNFTEGLFLRVNNKYCLPPIFLGTLGRVLITCEDGRAGYPRNPSFIVEFNLASCTITVYGCMDFVLPGQGPPKIIYLAGGELGSWKNINATREFCEFFKKTAPDELLDSYKYLLEAAAMNPKELDSEETLEILGILYPKQRKANVNN